jgi:hypothetical protein
VGNRTVTAVLTSSVEYTTVGTFIGTATEMVDCIYRLVSVCMDGQMRDCVDDK